MPQAKKVRCTKKTSDCVEQDLSLSNTTKQENPGVHIQSVPKPKTKKKKKSKNGENPNVKARVSFLDEEEKEGAGAAPRPDPVFNKDEITRNVGIVKKRKKQNGKRNLSPVKSASDDSRAEKRDQDTVGFGKKRRGPAESEKSNDDDVVLSPHLAIGSKRKKVAPHNGNHEAESGAWKKDSMEEASSPSDHLPTHHSSIANVKKRSKMTKRFRYSDKEVYGQTNESELEILINKYRRKGLPEHVAQQIRKKWEKREQRRLKRQQEKHSNKICFGCRKMGHELAECPDRKTNTTFSSGVCFKCGSSEHTLSSCKTKVQGFPFATCFVCGERGHLSRNCNNNANGVYPDGGTCKGCGMRDHLVKDCPEFSSSKKNEKEAQKVRRYPSDGYINPDDEDNVLLESDYVARSKKKSNVVRF